MDLRSEDKQIYTYIKEEEKRQKETLQMIPSENYTSKAVRETLGSVLTNKYSEGYAGKRYYQGNEVIDKVEMLAIDRAKKVFGVPHVNVQPYSGSPANAEVFMALLKPGDTIMGMSLPFGGHVTHGHPKVNFSGHFYNSVHYTTAEDGYIDYDEVVKLAKKHKPKIIISGTSAYPRKINFKKFGEIAESIKAWHLADISHIAGLVAGGAHPSPVRYAHVVTTTTHKTLRGPRGAMIMVTKAGLIKDERLAEKIDKAVFPGMQGGPHNNNIAGIAVAMKEVMREDFKNYAKQIVKNTKVLASELKKYGFTLLTGGSDNHLILIDMTTKGLDGWCAAWVLGYAGIITNRNSIPFDKLPIFYPAGVRLGTPYLTTLGMKENEMKLVAKWINCAIDAGLDILPAEIERSRGEFKKLISINKEIARIKSEVKSLCKRFENYPNLNL